MNKVTRMLVMTGMAFAASATIGAGAASAAQAAPASPSADSSAADSSAAKSNGDHRFGRTKVIGYYRSAILCHRIGNLGEWKNRWDEHECKRVRTPFHRGSWVLLARWDNHGGWNNHGGPGNWNNHGGPGNWNNNGGPGQHHGPNFPGNNPWDQKKH